MSGVRSTIVGTVNNANRTIANAGDAAGVAAHKMPRFNDNVANGIDGMNHQANVMNQNVARGMTMLDQQADDLNATAEAAVREANVMNQNVANGIDGMDHQADVMNQNVAPGMTMLDQQADDLSATAEAAVLEIQSAVESFDYVSEVVSSAIEMWSPSIEVFLNILGPLQYVMGADYFVLILKTMGILPTRNVPQSIEELNQTNSIFQDMNEAYREVESPGIVQKITKSSIVYDESSKTIQSYFFFSNNNMLVQQLMGLNYFAFDSISELFAKVYAWNAFADAAAQTKLTNEDSEHSASGICNILNKRRTNIYFLDPRPKSMVLPHMDFTNLHKSVSIVNHYQARQQLTIESIKVHNGCSLRLEHVTVGKIDAMCGGKAHLHQCNVGWNKVSSSPLSPSPIPFLFGGKPDQFNNPYNICGTVSCHECSTYDPSKNKAKMTNRKSIVSSPSTKFVRCPSDDPPFPSGSAALATIQRTITNLSDTVWCVKCESKAGVVSWADASHNDSAQIKMESSTKMIPPKGSVTFRITSNMRCKTILPISFDATLIFIDSNHQLYSHNCNGPWRNIPDFTVVCPTLSLGGGREVEHEHQILEDDKSATTCITTCTTSMKDESDEYNDLAKPVTPECRVKKNAILVVGRFGSGKSTLLNTLAGVYWKVIDEEFVAIPKQAGPTAEEFATSKAVKGCTVAAVAKDITTFDGRELTVIDTVGYDDTVNAESFYSTSNLTQVMDQFDEISAVVIVVNSRDRRFTQGFVESLACVPRSFKAQIHKNIVLAFTNWDENDEAENGDVPNRGFTQQMKVIREALGFGVDDDNVSIPSFWMDNRPFKECTETARRTIDSLKSFLNHLATMPQLSCREFKEMRALSQYERFVRRAIKEYFRPSNENVDAPSGFESLLFKSARLHARDLQKITWYEFTAKAWSEKLVEKMRPDILDQLPRAVSKICAEVPLELKPHLITSPVGQYCDSSVTGYVTKGLIHGGLLSIIITAPLSAGLSLVALPGCFLLAYGHSKTWSREDVIRRIVFAISQERGMDLCSIFTDRFTSHVDQVAEDLLKCFALEREDSTN